MTWRRDSYYLKVVASVISKKVNGKVYYYLAVSARVGGQPRIVEQKYLGSAEDIAAAVDGATAVPARSRHLGFGDLAAVWWVIDKLGVVEIIDAVIGERRSDAGASVGTYLALAAANRVVDPCSKRAFASWWAATAGDRLLKIRTSVLDHRRFWDAMHAVDTAALVEIEARLAQRVIEVFALDVSSLALDMTNFATFIDSANTKAPIAQRGKAKQKRFDLRLVGLGLVITRDGGIPLLSHAYPGNRNDVSQFTTMIAELVRRHHRLGGQAGELTVVFDAGQNSEANFTELTSQGLHYVGSVPPSDQPDLLTLPRSRYQALGQFRGLEAIEISVTALGRTHRGVLTHSAELHAGQSRGLTQTLATVGRELTQIADTLARGRARRTRAQLQAALDKIVNKQYVREVVTYTLTGDTPATFRLTWNIDPQARDALEDKIFGKRILITDRHDWTTADIVAGYRSQSDAEFSFRQMKDPHVVSFSPMHHFTDAHIRVHVFYCVLALMIAHLLRRHAHQHGLHLSVPSLLDTLAGIEETVLLYPGDRGRPKARRMITDTDPLQQQLFDLFELHRWAPVR
ncbi:MAG: IS1634 family transposase [Actinobacteria bacterium]|nr:IS1634 family transposase [Actinomycetota bacterium]